MKKMPRAAEGTHVEITGYLEHFLILTSQEKEDTIYEKCPYRLT